MLPSKSRSGYFDSGQKRHPSLLSRSISGSKLCRGDALVSQVHKGALISLERNPSKNRVVKKASAIQQQMGDLEVELKGTNEKLVVAEGERDRALQELQETKQVAHEAEMRLTEALSPKSSGKVFAELNSVKDSLSNAKQELDLKDKKIESLKVELKNAEGERDRALHELREMKQVAHEAEMRLTEALSPKSSGKVFAELNSVKDSVSNAKQELDLKDKKIESFKVELENAKLFELKLAEKEACLDRLNQDLSIVKASEARTLGLLSENNKRVEELEAQVEKGKVSESKMLESVESQRKEFEETKFELEESKLEIASLHEQIEKLQISSEQSRSSFDGSHTSENVDSIAEAFENLKSELQMAKENLACAHEGEKLASSKANALLHEMGLLKNELILAVDAEEKSQKAMDDFAIALKEVATEANLAKEKLITTETELEHVRGEAEQLKGFVRNTEDKYKKLLDEAKKEIELQRNTSDRLRLEAEESLLAWNGKEMGFVGCIKRAEEEKAIALHENHRLVESLKAAESSTRTARQESYKLRDILKQAINEANVAKEAASIARAENSQLKDDLAEKDEALHFLTQENERLRINEAAANENIKELKRFLSAEKTELKTEDKELKTEFNSPDSSIHEDEVEDAEEPRKGFSFDLNELRIFDIHDLAEVLEEEEDPEKAEALKGSIFDTTVSPKSEPQTPQRDSHHRRDSSIAFTDEGGTPTLEDLDQTHGSHFDDHDADERNPHRRRLFRRLSDLITRKSYHKREPSTVTE